jgi:hypothetical protein
VSNCRSCGAPVIMLRSASTGKMAPINAEPDPAGNILINAKRGEYLIVKKAAREAGMVLLHRILPPVPTLMSGTRRSEATFAQRSDPWADRKVILLNRLAVA